VIEDDALPSFPVSPPGESRMAHLPTIEAAILYWEAVHTRAIRTSERGVRRTALSLRTVYEELKRDLIQPRRGEDTPIEVRACRNPSALLHRSMRALQLKTAPQEDDRRRRSVTGTPN
jgi:hypothetical protein